MAYRTECNVSVLWGSKSEIKVRAVLVPSENCEETSVLCSLLDSSGLLTVFEVPCSVAGGLPVSSRCLLSRCTLFSVCGILFIKTRFILD